MNILDKIFLSRFKKFIQTIEGDKIWLLDIDNTFADTWPNLKNKRIQNILRFYETLPLLKGSNEYFNTTIKGDPYYFLTVRNKMLYYSTKAWLNRHNLFVDYNLSLLSDVQLKCTYIDVALANNLTVHFLDDLSYGHESGTIKYHDREIGKVIQKGIYYYDYNFIKKLNS
jgi:hypothetical protein